MDYISNYLPEDIKSNLFAKDKKENTEFRESSKIQIEKKPCGCMSSNVKENSSS